MSSRPSQPPAAGKRAFVTGGTGFIGSHLVRHLVESGDTVAILLRPQSDPWRILDVLGRVQVIEGRVSEATALSSRLNAFRPEIAYHLAWSGTTTDDREDARQLTENVADAVTMVELTAGAGATTWVGLGSQAEFGPAATVLDESTPARPTTPYGAAKLSAGRLTADLCASRSMRHVWLRLLTAYGPADHPSYLIPLVILSLLRGRKPPLTEGDQPGDFLQVRDVCAAIRGSASADACAGTYVLASGDHRPIREVASTIRDMIDPSLKLGFGEVVPSRPPTGLRGDPRALETVTGWSPQVSLEVGLAECIDWYRRNLNRFSKENEQ